LSTNSYIPDAYANVLFRASQNHKFVLCENAFSISDCGDSLFNAVAILTNDEFDGQSLRRYMAQSFSNMILSKQKIALECKQTCI
jgi:hypothetical protein